MGYGSLIRLSGRFVVEGFLWEQNNIVFILRIIYSCFCCEKNLLGGLHDVHKKTKNSDNEILKRRNIRLK